MVETPHSRPVAVLYVHGLESGPGGTKARNLTAAGFTVFAAQMPCNRQAMIRDPWFLAASGALLASVIALGFSLGAGAGLVAVAAVALGTPRLKSAWFERAFERSIAVQVAMLHAHPIDVIVGSSFGGAVSLALIQRGKWNGPAVLLCPAHRLVAKAGRVATPPPLVALPASGSRRVVVVHGAADETVPFDDSEALVAGSAAPFIRVDDNHRLSQTATPENLRSWVARALAASG